MTSTPVSVVRERILGHPVDAVHPELVVGLILDRCMRRAHQSGEGAAYICLSNVHTTVESRHSPQLRAAVERAFLSVPDGEPLAWLLRRRGLRSTRKVRGTDFMRLLATAGREAGLRHFLYGGAPGVADAAARELRRQAPGVKIVGNASPPFSAAGDWPLEALKEQLRRTRPDVVWVGVGAPKQELWMARVAAEMDVCVLIGVGAAFDFVAGAKAEAPRLLIRLGLEWLFRLVSEPRRLWRRYLLGNAAFVYLVVRAAVSSRWHPSRPSGAREDQ